MISKKDMQVFKDIHRVLLRTKDFICLHPHPELSEYISNYNITFPTKVLMPEGFTVMPCGCSTLSIEDNSKNLHVFLKGPTTKPYVAGSRTNQLKMLITVEFKPAGLFELTGISQSELVDKSVSFEAVNPKLNKLVREAVEKAESVHELADGFDMLLLENMYAAYQPQVKRTIQHIVGCSGNIAVKKLSEDIYYSERQLNRIFKQQVGVSAKAFSKLIRINNAFHLVT